MVKELRTASHLSATDAVQAAENTHGPKKTDLILIGTFALGVDTESSLRTAKTAMTVDKRLQRVVSSADQSVSAVASDTANAVPKMRKMWILKRTMGLCTFLKSASAATLLAD